MAFIQLIVLVRRPSAWRPNLPHLQKWTSRELRLQLKGAGSCPLNDWQRASGKTPTSEWMGQT